MRDKRMLVAEKHHAVCDCDDVVVKRAGIDGRRVLLREQRAARIEAMPPGNGLRRFSRLPRRIALHRRRGRVQSHTSIDEEPDPGP